MINFTPHSVASDLGLHCLPMSIFGTLGFLNLFNPEFLLFNKSSVEKLNR